MLQRWRERRRGRTTGADGRLPRTSGHSPRGRPLASLPPSLPGLPSAGSALLVFALRRPVGSFTSGGSSACRA
eukprot:10220769-Alexandrium_andersonii.AAC.1